MKAPSLLERFLWKLEPVIEKLLDFAGRFKPLVDLVKEQAKTNFAVFFASCFSVLMLFLTLQGAWRGSDNRWQDALFLMDERMTGGKLGDKRIIVIAIDDDSIKHLGAWPFPRNLYAQALDRMKELAVKTVVFDVLFPDPNILHPDGDDLLGQATARSGNVVHLATIETQITKDGRIGMVRPPIPQLVKTSQYLAYPNVNNVVDPDGHIRRAMVFDDSQFYDEEYTVPYPSLDVAAAASFTGKPLKYFVDKHRRTRWYAIINSRAPQQWVYHPGWPKSVDEPESYIQSVYRYISIMDLLQDRLSNEERRLLRGSLALIASTSIGLYDHYPSPFMSTFAGVEIHANSIDNILNDDYVKQMTPLVALFFTLLFIWVPVSLRKLSAMRGASVVCGVLALWTLGNYALYKMLWHLDFVAPAVSLAGSFMVLSVHRVLTEQQEKRWIRNTFGQYLSPKVVDAVVSDPSKLKLGGDRRDMSVFFLDIAHFTTISEKMDPEELTRFLNKYFSALTDIIMKYDGVVDKYIGDCIMAFWNAPVDQPRHRALICQAAVECQEVMESLNAEAKRNGATVTPDIRIGINSGAMVVGNMGSNMRFSYTVIGDEVNLGSRLEGANKFFGTRIMASESTLSGAEDSVEYRELGRVRVVGKQVPIRVYELLGKKGQLPAVLAKTLPIYVEGLGHYQNKNFAEAQRCFQQVVKLNPDDKPSAIYLKACNDYVLIPPPAEWEPVFSLTAK